MCVSVFKKQGSLIPAACAVLGCCREQGWGVPVGPAAGPEAPRVPTVAQPCCAWCLSFWSCPFPLTVDTAVSSGNVALLCFWAWLKFFPSPLPDWLFTWLSSHNQEWKGQRKELGERGRDWKHHSSPAVKIIALLYVSVVLGAEYNKSPIWLCQYFIKQRMRDLTAGITTGIFRRLLKCPLDVTESLNLCTQVSRHFREPFVSS